jgi:hypothetical protein
MVQKVLSSSLLSKNIRIKIYRTVILSVVLCGFETWSLIWREEYRLTVFENSLLRRILGPRMDELTGEWRRLQDLHDLYSSPNIIRVIKSRRMRWVNHIWGRGEVCTGFWWGVLKEGDHLEDLCTDGRIILKWIFKK